MYVVKSRRPGGLHLALILTSHRAALLAQLAPTNTALSPAVPFSATATAKAMNEALKLTRHLPVSASSPLSRLLASKGSLEWEESCKAKQEVVPETARVGWRVLEKEDRLSTLEELKPKRAPSGFLSFWSRRASAIQPAPVEVPGEPPASPARLSSESVKSAPHPLPSRAASPPKASAASVPLPTPTDSYPIGLAAAPAPSAVSRFLNRFSLARSNQHSALALSSDDIEFLSDIVPSASDPSDGINDGILSTSTGANSPSPLPPKLPPPIPPPPTQPTLSGGMSMNAGVQTVSQVQGANYTPNIPVLAPPLSPKPASSFLRAQNSSSLKGAATPTIAFEQPSTSIQQRLQPSSQPSSRPRPLSPLREVPPLALPPLLPPPPVSPPQTPRPNIMPPVHASTVHSSGTTSTSESDDEFSAFTSFPAPVSTPFPSSCSDPPPRSPSPPSPPPRRTYDRTHYPSSSSTSSILSPASQSSVDRLYSTKTSVSASLDGFDDFVSASPARQENRKHTPSPPPLPAKSPFQQLPPIDTYPSRARYSHTPSQSFASPTVHTSLISPVPSVRDAEHQRTQALVNHAAARGGMLWPNSPESDELKVKAIPPPPSSTSPPPVSGESFDLLGDGDTGLSKETGVGLRASSHAAGPGNGLALGNRLQPSPPPASAPIFSSFLGTNAGSLPPTKPKQMGGLSAQDLSFFEGL